MGKIRYDKDTDVLTITITDGYAVTSSVELAPGVMVDYDHDGCAVAIKFLDAEDSWFERFGEDWYEKQYLKYLAKKLGMKLVKDK